MAPKASLLPGAETPDATKPQFSQGFRQHARRNSNPQPPDPQSVRGVRASSVFDRNLRLSSGLASDWLVSFRVSSHRLAARTRPKVAGSPAPTESQAVAPKALR